MKRISQIAIGCLVLSMLASCGEKKITVKGADGTVYESYQEACAAEDFQAAHVFLEKMQNIKFEDPQVRLSAEHYVYGHELFFLMSQGNEDAKKRIIYLLKEAHNNSYVADVIDLAIEDDDEAFVKRLANLYTFGDIDRLRKVGYYLASKEDNFDENKTYWISLVNRLGYSDYLLEDSPFDKKE